MADGIVSVLEGDVWLPDGVAERFEDDDDKLATRLASLTTAQLRVLMMIKDGLLNKQIAYDLNVAEATIKAHVSAIFRKLR